MTMFIYWKDLLKKPTWQICKSMLYKWLSLTAQSAVDVE